MNDIPSGFMEKVEQRLVACDLVEKAFINSVAFNAYSDGTTGLGSHFDDMDRFARPIVTVRLFSDSRLSFGCRYFSTSNGLMCVPLPRGCVLVMEKHSFASDEVKHCIRNCDLGGKSGAIILRHVHPFLLGMAGELDGGLSGESEVEKEEC